MLWTSTWAQENKVSGGKGEDVPFSEKMFGCSFCTLFVTNTPEIAFSCHLGTLIF